MKKVEKKPEKTETKYFFDVPIKVYISPPVPTVRLHSEDFPHRMCAVHSYRVGDQFFVRFDANTRIAGHLEELKAYISPKDYETKGPTIAMIDSSKRAIIYRFMRILGEVGVKFHVGIADYPGLQGILGLSEKPYEYYKAKVRPPLMVKVDSIESALRVLGFPRMTKKLVNYSCPSLLDIYLPDRYPDDMKDWASAKFNMIHDACEFLKQYLPEEQFGALRVFRTRR